MAGSSLINTMLTSVISKNSGGNRFTETVANRQVNGFLFDFYFTVPESYSGKWDFLKKVICSISLRCGDNNIGSIPLISDVTVYDLLIYSDMVAGVSMSGTDFEVGGTARISGYIDTGFFAMGSRDALEVSLTCEDKTSMPSNDVTFIISSVFKSFELTSFKLYKMAKPTGADQPYRNVLDLFYIGDDIVNANATVTDMIGNKTVNIEDAIALTNATGEFEFFTRMGQIYHDEYNISQDLSFRVPNTDNESTVLVVQYGFFPQILENNSSDMVATRNGLLETIKNSDSDKYNYLTMLGLA